MSMTELSEDGSHGTVPATQTALPRCIATLRRCISANERCVTVQTDYNSKLVSKKMQ